MPASEVKDLLDQGAKAMSDTSMNVEARIRKLMLARSPGKRLATACDMFATAKALVRAGIAKEVGPKGPATMREHLFLRLYGKDFLRPTAGDCIHG